MNPPVCRKCKRRLPPVVSCMLLVLACNTSIAETVEGLVVGIADGDTFTLLTADQRQIKICVAEIDAPERGQPYASRSRQQLADLIFQKDLSVRVQVIDRYNRVVGRPAIGDMDVAVEMIRSGAAWVYRTYSDDYYWQYHPTTFAARLSAPPAPVRCLCALVPLAANQKIRI